MSANNFSLPTTHIFSDVPIDGITHSVVYICGGEMVSQPSPKPQQKNYDLFHLSDEEDGLEGLELLPPLPPKKKKKGAKADYQARKEARRLKKQAALDTINAVFVGIRTRNKCWIPTSAMERRRFQYHFLEVDIGIFHLKVDHLYQLKQKNMLIQAFLEQMCRIVLQQLLYIYLD